MTKIVLSKFIANVFLTRDQAEKVADYWRGQDASARILSRTVRAAGLATRVYAVVVTPKAKAVR